MGLKLGDLFSEEQKQKLKQKSARSEQADPDKSGIHHMTESFKDLIEQQGLEGFDKGQDRYGDPDQSHQKGKVERKIVPREPESQIDLHGEFVADAAQKVEDFVNGMRQAGYSWVLIITGIGRHSEGSRSKLRPVVVQKLNEMKNQHRLKDFQTAQPRHGGMGAIYVYLK